MYQFVIPVHHVTWSTRSVLEGIYEKYNPKHIYVITSENEIKILKDKLNFWSQKLTEVPEIFNKSSEDFERLKLFFKVQSLSSLGEIENTANRCLEYLINYLMIKDTLNRPFD